MEIGKLSTFFFNEKCEVAFSKTYFKEKCGYTFPREHYSTPTKYFNQYLLNYSPKFVSKGGYIFFRNQYGYEKVSGPLIAGMFTNYEEKVEHFVSNYQGFLFMDQINGALAYSKKFQREMLAMVKQLGCSIFSFFDFMFS